MVTKFLPRDDFEAEVSSVKSLSILRMHTYILYIHTNERSHNLLAGIILIIG